MEEARLISRFLRKSSPAAHPDVVYSPVLTSTSFLTVIACSPFVSWCVLLQLFSAAPAPPWVILLSHHYLPCTSSSAHCLVLCWECSREQQSLPSSHTCFLLFSSMCISVFRLQHLFSCFPFFGGLVMEWCGYSNRFIQLSARSRCGLMFVSPPLLLSLAHASRNNDFHWILRE